MNIEKLKNYNQKVLAIIGTLIICFGVVGLIVLIFTLISDLFPIQRENDFSLLSEEKVEELIQDSLRQEILSYEMPQLIDTVNLIYLIPVSHAKLKYPEGISGKIGYDDHSRPISIDHPNILVLCVLH